MKIVFLDRATLSPAPLPALTGGHEWVDFDASTPEQVAERAAGAQVLVSNKVKVTADALRRLPGLRLIAVPATGLDHVDLGYCRDHGIAVINCPDYSALSVPEHAIALLLALRRNLFAYRDAVREGAWARAGAFFAELYPLADLHGQTLGIVGAGRLGRRTAELAQAFGMKVLYAEHKQADAVRQGYTAFGDVLAQSDALSLHCPLNAQTRGLIGAAELARMKRTALLVNTARGGLVDEAALLSALADGTIAGAGLDVLAHEPPSPDDPLLQYRGHNLVVTPHVAWRTPLAAQRLADQLIAGIQAFLDRS